MNIQLHSAATSMRELQKKVDTIADNLANTNTNGFKRREASFSDALTQSFNRQAGAMETGRLTPNGIRIGAGAVLSATALRTEQGGAVQTGRLTDFMLQGEGGYFRVGRGDEVFYTRDGSFDLRPGGAGQVELVTANGESVLGADGNPIMWDDDYDVVSATADGTIEVTFRDALKEPAVFQLGIARIERQAGLQHAGGSLLRLPGDEAAMLANGTLEYVDLRGGGDALRVVQGSLEGSNVNMADEMTELIATQRLIQSQSRAISYADDMSGLVNNLRR